MTTWAKKHEHSGMVDKKRGYLLKLMAIDPSFSEALRLLDKAGVQPLRASCKNALMLVLCWKILDGQSQPRIQKRIPFQSMASREKLLDLKDFFE